MPAAGLSASHRAAVVVTVLDSCAVLGGCATRVAHKIQVNITL